MIPERQPSPPHSTADSGITKKKENTTPILCGRRVLVVEDEKDVCQMLALILETNGAEVTAVASAAAALDELDRERPDVFICDIGMPQMDGYSLIGKVRALPQGQTIPAIALTAYTKEEDRSRALASGFQIHIPKPVDPEELVAIVAGLVAQ